MGCYRQTSVTKYYLLKAVQEYCRYSVCMPPPKIIYYQRTTRISTCHTQQGQNPSVLLACVILPMGNKVWAQSQMWQIPKITSWALTLLTIKWCKDDIKKSSKRQQMARHLDFLIFKRTIYNETMGFYSREPRWSFIPWMEKTAKAETMLSRVFILR